MSHTVGPIDEPTAEALRILGRILYELRRQRGLSQRALAARCGLSQSTISRLENGLAPGVRIAWIARLLAGLDLDIPAPGHEPWNAWTAPGWALLMDRFATRGRLAARLALEAQRVPERPKGGHPYRKRPPIKNPSEAYLFEVEQSKNIMALEAARQAENPRTQARLLKAIRARIQADAQADAEAEADDAEAEAEAGNAEAEAEAAAGDAETEADDAEIK
jgi:transcriptional regulator with XRE-family HTH domain